MKDEVKRVVASWLARGLYKEAGEVSGKSALRAERSNPVARRGIRLAGE
jgi:hypothetical protein